MTPEEYIGHRAFRTYRSDLWPVREMPCFASWLRFRDGTVIFYLRGPIKVSQHPRQVADVVSEEIYGVGEACHRCLFESSFGRYTEDGEYIVRFSTTQKQGRENRWGVLCKHCREQLARKATQKWRARLLELGFHPKSDAISGWINDD